eukprot:IDg4342t1
MSRKEEVKKIDGGNEAEFDDGYHYAGLRILTGLKRSNLFHFFKSRKIPIYDLSKSRWSFLCLQETERTCRKLAWGIEALNLSSLYDGRKISRI